MHFLTLFLCFTLSYPLIGLFATSEEELSRYQMTEATLKNGLQVCLKKTDLEIKEFAFQLFATGGVSHLSAIDQPSGWLAANIAWESGLDQLTADELDCILDNHSVELSVKIGYFDRQIDAAGSTRGLSYCLRLARLLFTNPQFNEAGFKKVLVQTRQRLQKWEETLKFSDEQVALKVNLKNWYPIAPFTSLDLGKVELQKAKEIFRRFFLNPAEFRLVIVGDFDPQEVMTLLEESLGSLPASPVSQWNLPPPPSFPEGITKKELEGISRYRHSVTRLTFPLSTQAIDPVTLDLLCFILKKELTSEITAEELKQRCFNVSYAFPLFPYVQPCWLVVKFRSSVHQVQPISQLILKKIDKIKREGITDTEMKEVYQELAKKKAQVSDNAHMLSLIADFYRAGWNLHQLYTMPDQEQEREIVKKVQAAYPSTDQYSIISLQP